MLSETYYRHDELLRESVNIETGMKGVISNMDIEGIIKHLESEISNPSEGLPEEIFLFATGITPMINVDLLIKNESRQTLLTWREDCFFGPGWHIPGGIIRYKESIEKRLHAVAATELGVKIAFDDVPLAINEVIQQSRRSRGHFISLLYNCKLLGVPDDALMHKGGEPRAGEWRWHSDCPDNIISVHEMYRKFMSSGGK